MENNRFLTGADLLDVMVGGGAGLGFPGGRIINIVGNNSSGKTFLACEIVAQAFHRFGERLKWVYDDAESGFTFDTKSLYGVEIMPEDEKERVKSRTVEEWACNCRAFLEGLKKDDVGIYIMDTLDGLSSDELDDRAADRQKAFAAGKDFEKGSYQMGAAKFLSQEFFKTITPILEDKGALLIIISQVRDNVGGVFSYEKNKRSGGRALDFYAHTVLWLNRKTKIKRSERDVGALVNAKTKKSKTPRPFRECDFLLYFDYGVDNIGTSLDFLFDLRTDGGKLSTAAKKISWGGGNPGIKELRDFAVEMLGMGGNEPIAEIREKITGAFTGEGSKNIKEAYEKRFGAVLSRDELITYIEENNLEDELRARVVEKWENLEAKCKTNRKSKF